MTTIRSSCILVTVFLGAAGSLASAYAATPADELLRLTPTESSFCLVVRDLRGNYDAVSNGPLATAFRDSKLGKVFADSPEVKQIDELGKQVSQHLGADWPQIRDNVFGDAVVFAYQAGPPGKPEEERGLILTWAREPALVQKLLDRLDTAQKQSGELKETRVLTHRERKYLRRSKNKGQDEFVYQRDNVLVFSQQEAALRRVIELDLGAADAVSPIAEELKKLGFDRSFAALWLNTRSFDAELDAKLKQAKAGEEAFLRTFRGIWKALDGLALAVDLGQHLEVRLALSTRPADLPPALRRFAEGGSETSSLWDAFPQEPMFAAAFHLDPASWIDALSTFMTDEARASLKASLEQTLGPVFGKATLPLLPEHLGPDVGVCVSAPPTGAKAPVPQVVAAIRVRSGKEAGKLEQAILNAMDVLSTLVRLGYNANHAEPIRSATVRQGDVEVKYLASDGFPQGLEPAYALKGGYLVVASSPAVIERTNPKPRATGDATVANRLLLISFRQIDRFLGEHGAALVALAAAGNNVPKNEVADQIAKIRMGLELLDRLELISERPGAGRASLTLRLHFTKPLKK